MWWWWGENVIIAWVGNQCVYVPTVCMYAAAAAVWQCCTGQRTGWIIPAPSKEPHLRSSGHDTYSESPKLSHTPRGQQRPTRKSERNREIGGGGGWCDGRREGVEAERRKLERGGKKGDDSWWLKDGDNVSCSEFKCFLETSPSLSLVFWRGRLGQHTGLTHHSVWLGSARWSSFREGCRMTNNTAA